MSTNPKMKTKKRMRVSRKTKPKPSAPLIGTEAETKMVLTVQIKTGMPSDQVKEQYAQFLTMCPDGAMTKEKFTDLSVDALGDQADFLADSMFKSFDIDSNGTMDFTEYMLAINSTGLNTPEDKLKWMFDVFDKDGGGTISTEEIDVVLQGLFEMSGKDFEDNELDLVTRDIMDAIDADGDGEVTKDEFIENAMKCQFIAGMLA